MSIYLGNLIQGIEVVSISLHPVADLALLVIDDSDSGLLRDIFKPFHGVGQVHEAGFGAAAFGYPEDSSETGLEPIPRMFRGFFQRTFNYRSMQWGFTYVADELSFPIPQGLSGGPIVCDSSPWEVVGVAAEVVRAQTYVKEITEVIEPGHEPRREKAYEFVQYGIAVRLQYVQEWLQELVPDSDPLR